MKVVDYCDGIVDPCGANGFCISNVTAGKYQCKCHLFYEGAFCNKCKIPF